MRPGFANIADAADCLAHSQKGAVVLMNVVMGDELMAPPGGQG